MKEIRRLDKAGLAAYKKLNTAVLETLPDAAWFIPFSAETIEGMFDPGSTLTVYGCFMDGALAAVSMLDTDWEEMAEVAEAAGMPKKKKGAELGGSMVLPAYRGQGLMLEINQTLMNAAKEMGIDYLVATAHPDNIASNTSLRKMGMIHKGVINRQGHYMRNVYLLEF